MLAAIIDEIESGNSGGNMQERVRHLMRGINDILRSPAASVNRMTPPTMVASALEIEQPTANVGKSSNSMETQGGNSWATIVRGNQLTAKGNPLSFIAPVLNDGKAVAQLDKLEVDKLSAAWENAIVMYVVGELSSIVAIMRFVDRECHLTSKPHVLFIMKSSSLSSYLQKRIRIVS